jgi:aminomethyltransferase
MPVQYGGIREEHVAVRDGVRRLRRLAHGRDRDQRAAGQELLQRLLSNDVEKLAVGGAQYSVLCREDGGVLDDLFTYRTGPDRFLTVTNAANHDKDLAWFQAHAGGFDAEVADALTATRCSPSRARGRARSSRRWPTRRCPALHDARRAGSCGRSALVCGTGYTARTASRSSATRRRRPLWDELAAPRRAPAGPGRARHPAPRGLLPPLRQRPDAGARPIEAGLGWCCKEDTGFIGSDAVRAGARGRPA